MKKESSPHWILESHILRPDEYRCSACGRRCPKPEAVCPGCRGKMGRVRDTLSWIDEIEFPEDALTKRGGGRS